MIAANRILTRPAVSEDYSKLANLFHFGSYLHQHRDYRHPLDWIGHEMFLLLEDGGRLEAALACPPDPPDVAWVRLFAVSHDIPPESAWNTLWKAMLPLIRSDPQIGQVAAIPSSAWFESLLKKQGFPLIQEIVMLNRDLTGLPREKPDPQVGVRPMTLDDLKTVHLIDKESFAPIWVNSPASIEIAFRQAWVATVAEINGQIEGYQISSKTTLGAHLSRLAVRPAHQGEGIGYALVYDLIRQLSRHGAHLLTVNTQKDNRASLSLYQRAGFELTGEASPVYMLEVNNQG